MRERFPTRVSSILGPSSSSKALFIPSRGWTRKTLQEQWDKATLEAKSASVMIMNEVDGEEVPGVPEDFQYLERGYDWGKYAPDPNFLIGCNCADNCNGTDTEGCCIKRSLFHPETTCLLPRECNIVSYLFEDVESFLPPGQNCSCNETCRTRVAQKPRKIPL